MDGLARHDFSTVEEAFDATTASVDLPMYDENRPALRYDLGKAWHHFRRLIANKEDTREVFHIFEALPWLGMRDAAEQFLTSPKGQSLRANEPFLPELLDDHAALRRTPKGSLAHAYCDFMEAEGLTAQGLVDEFELFMEGRPKFEDQFKWYFHRVRDTHDLLHVLTNYGRDALGELCVLGFTYSQQPSPAHLFIGYAGAWELTKKTRVSAPVFRAVREGQRLGKACPRLAELPMRELLPLPLDDVRRRLSITPASRYDECHARWRAAGLDPYDLFKPAA